MNLLRRGWTWLADEPHQTRGVRVLQVAIGAMLLFRFFTEMRYAAYLWGPRGLGSGSMIPLFGNLAGGLLDHLFTTQTGTDAALLILGIGALGLVLGYRTRVATGMALFAFLLLEERLPDLPDGGDNIARLVLCYMLFLIPAGGKRLRGSLSVWVHNIAVLAIMLQVGVLYGTAGLAKAYGDLWHHGTAMYYISQVQWFSLPAMRQVFKNGWITTLSSYGAVLYQLWFPIAIISPLRRSWIVMGIFFHLSIAIFMGLITFSTVMIGLDLIFISDREYAKTEEVIHRSFPSLVTRLQNLASSRKSGSSDLKPGSPNN
jgi:hypothetical protein